MDLLSVDSIFLEQGSILVSLIEDGNALDSVIEESMISCAGNACTFQVPVNPFFFGPDHPPHLTLKGSVIVAHSHKTTQKVRPLHEGEFSGLAWMEPFETLLSLQQTDDNGYTERPDISANSDSQNYILFGLRCVFAALVLAACFTFWMQRRLRRTGDDF